MRLLLLSQGLFGLALAMGPGAPAQAEPVPADHITFETIPAAIRADGVDSFIIQAYVPMAATSVTIKPTWGQAQYIKPAPNALLGITLKDDGQGADKVAGDRIYTAGPFTYDTTKPFPANYGDDPDSPAGIYLNALGELRVTFQDSRTYPTFMSAGHDPGVGLVRKDLPAVALNPLSADITAASHMVNVRHDEFISEKMLRRMGGSPTVFTGKLYSVLPDEFDQFLLFSTYHLHSVRSGATGGSAVAGVHWIIQNDVQGLGLGLFDGSAAYGSAGRLKGINVFGAGRLRSALVTHEISHTWQAFLTYPGYRLSESGHWWMGNSLGDTWKDNGNGTFTLECGGEASQASNMARYLMGLSGPHETQPVRVLENENWQRGPGYECGKVITRPYTTLTIDDLVAHNGVREPAYDRAQRDFRLLFVTQTNDRHLNATEMTFYNTLAQHLAAPATAPRPVTQTAWRPLASWYVGTTWETALNAAGGEDTVPPVITLKGAASMDVVLNGSFVDPGASASDNVDGDISHRIRVSGTVNTAVAGTYTLRYNVTDQAGNAAAEVVRTVKVVDQAACVSATNYQHVAAGRAYTKTVMWTTSAYANGSDDNLGYYGSVWFSPVSALQESGPGRWVKVSACP